VLSPNDGVRTGPHRVGFRVARHGRVHNGTARPGSNRREQYMHGEIRRAIRSRIVSPCAGGGQSAAGAFTRGSLENSHAVRHRRHPVGRVVTRLPRDLRHWLIRPCAIGRRDRAVPRWAGERTTRAGIASAYRSGRLSAQCGCRSIISGNDNRTFALRAGVRAGEIRRVATVVPAAGAFSSACWTRRTLLGRWPHPTGIPCSARVGAILKALIAREPVERRPTIRAWLPHVFVPPQVTIVSAKPSTEVLIVRSLGSTMIQPRLSSDDVLYWRADVF